MENKHKSSQYESPLRYPGGKACIFPFISKLFFENNIIGSQYAEPYAGGAGLALKLLFNEHVSKILINDLDKSIYLFWLTILNRANYFCDWIEDVSITVESWNYYRQIQQNQNLFGDFEIAKSTFFLNRTNVSGVLKGGVIGGISQKGKYKIDARFNKNDLINRIQKISQFRDRIEVSNDDGLRFITKLNSLSENVFIYLDPPYYQKGADLYMNFYSNQDHRKLARRINRIKKDWLVSYDNHSFILNLYSKQRKISYRLSQSASNRVGDEILIFSPNIKYHNSIQSLKTPKQV